MTEIDTRKAEQKNEQKKHRAEKLSTEHKLIADVLGDSVNMLERIRKLDDDSFEVLSAIITDESKKVNTRIGLMTYILGGELSERLYKNVRQMPEFKKKKLEDVVTPKETKKGTVDRHHSAEAHEVAHAKKKVVTEIIDKIAPLEIRYQKLDAQSRKENGQAVKSRLNEVKKLISQVRKEREKAKVREQLKEMGVDKVSQIRSIKELGAKLLKGHEVQQVNIKVEPVGQQVVEATA